MRKLFFSCLASGLFITAGYAQTLFTYGPNSVSKEEFLRVYKKNSITKQPDMSDTALRSYLDLYALFRMKVSEANKEKLDTVQSIDHELDTYRKQLSKNYLTDDKVTHDLITEAYGRMKEDVHVEHILISCPLGADTVAAYRKIDSIYHLVESKKADFESLAKEFSDDKGSKEHGGDLGYFTALQTVYPFENAAYNTPVGTVSAPFRTQFGYHIIKVLDKHADRGQVKVAQILIQVSKSRGEEGDIAAHNRADRVEMLLKSGVPFETLVAQYSDDKYSTKDSGILKPFGAGRMVPAFENAAFALKSPGDISAPVKTDYGYHIIKLIAKYPLQPYDTLYANIKHKVENDSREQTAKDYFSNKIKAKNGFREYPENFNELSARVMALPDTGRGGKIIKASEFKHMSKPLFELAGKKYLQSDFATFFETLTHGRVGPKSGTVRDAYNMYVNSVVNDFEEHKLVEENPEFKSLMEEYRDGIMLFELMDRNVWSKAARDSAGLQTYYEQHKTKYMWEPGFEGAVYKFKNKAALDTGLILIKRGDVTDEDLAKIMNKPSNPDAVTIQHGRYEFDHFKTATQAELEQNKIKIVETPGSQVTTVVVAKEIYKTPGQKTLDEARGYVVAEYQDYLEKEWNEKMRAEYPLKVNEKVFRSMVKK